MERADLLADACFENTDKRSAHATELAANLDPIFAAHPWLEWRERLRRHEITFGLLGVLSDAPHDEQAVANGAVVSSAMAEMPRMVSAPIRLSFAPEPALPRAAPGHGQHTDEVLAELGYQGRLRGPGALG
jgi:formyl-CoA transferase